MKINPAANGCLILVADKEEIETLTSIKERVGGDDIAFLMEMLDITGLSPNGKLHHVPPEKIGAITDAPIVTDELETNDAGEITRLGRLWWFPQYVIKDFGQELIETGNVVFFAAPA